MGNKILLWSFFVCAFFLIGACTTFYQIHLAVNQNFENGSPESALKLLSKNTKMAEGRNRFLFQTNEGQLQQQVQDYVNSNKSLEKAYLFTEDYSIKYGTEALALLLNPTFSDYKGEVHELLMINYLKVLNYLMLQDLENALVEVRRLNERLKRLGDQITSSKKFHRDAFMHVVMGLIYDASKDPNNAFIAYRNALNIYQEDYLPMFGLDAPAQLKKDLIRTAYQIGLYEDASRYEKQFKLKYTGKDSLSSSQAIVLWHNGLIPVKEQWALTFVCLRQGHNLIFYNELLGLRHEYTMSDEDYKNGGWSSLKTFKIAFPTYTDRPQLDIAYSTLSFQGKDYALELGEDLGGIAKKALKDRMVTEIAKGIFRFASKKATEYAIREKNKDLGAFVGLFETMLEQADTRNWQTLPNKIFYKRIYSQPGPQTLQLKGQSITELQESFQIDFKEGKTIFVPLYANLSKNQKNRHQFP